MSKYVKISIILLLFLNGCSKPTVPEHFVIFDHPIKIGVPVGKILNTPLSSIAVAINPLIFERVVSQTNPDASRIFVHGLKDRVLENRINQDIQIVYDRLLSYKKVSDLPYRGILDLAVQKELGNQKIDFTPTFNYNNVLSIVANGSYPYTDKTGYSSYVTIVDTLNYDLSTGRVLTIADLFTNDANIEDLLNNKVNELIRKTSSEYMDFDKLMYGQYLRLEPVSPFRGIQGDQVFALGEAGIQLFFDYRTPAFNTFAKAFQYDIAYSAIRPYFAADRRFVDDQPIYLDPVKDHRFLYDTDYTALTSDDKQITVDGHTWYFNMRYPETLDPFYLNRMTTMRNETRDQVLTQYPNMIDYMSNYIYAHQLGKFILIDSSTSLSSSKWGVNLQVHECYVGRKRFTLKQIFADGFDFETLIKPKILTQVAYFDANLKLISRYAEYRSNLGFTFNETSLTLSAFALSPIDNKPYPIEIYISYEEIGGENLTIFDQS